MISSDVDNLDKAGLISGGEIDTSILHKYFPTKLVYRRAQQLRKPIAYENKSNDSSASSLTPSSSSDNDSELDFRKDISISMSSSSNIHNRSDNMNDRTTRKTTRKLDLWRNDADKKLSHNEDADEDNHKNDDSDNSSDDVHHTQLEIPKYQTRLQQLTRKSSPNPLTRRKRSTSKPSKRKRQELARLIARKEHADQVRHRNESIFGEYGSTFIYAVISLGLTFLTLHFLGYSKDIQPVISLQLWLVFGVGSAVVFFLLVEAFYASRPLFIKVNQPVVPSPELTNKLSQDNIEISQRDETTPQDEPPREGTLITSISCSSIDIYDGDNEVDDHPSQKRDHGNGGESKPIFPEKLTESEDPPFKSPYVPNRVYSKEELDELSDQNLTQIGEFPRSSNKLSPMSALESN